MLKTTANIEDDQASTPVRPGSSTAWRVDEDRAERLAFRLTIDQIEAIARDTRLPGEIGYSLGCSAAVVIRLQERGRQLIRKREKLAAEREP